MENNSVLDQLLFHPVAGALAHGTVISKTNGGLWMFLYTVVSLLSFCMLWLDTSYWPWYFFVILWVMTLFGVLCQSIAVQLIPPNAQSIAFDICWFALQTFSTHVNVLGALHVLDTSVWATLFVMTITGVLLFMPHWAAVVRHVVVFGRWSSPTEMRIGATTVSLLLSPAHALIRAAGYGDYIALAMTAALLLPITAYVLDTSHVVDEKRKKMTLVMHALFSVLPSVGMATWAFLDPWLAASQPVVFAGVLIVINTHVVARVYVLRALENRNVIISVVEFTPFLGALISLSGLVAQPYALLSVHLLAFFLTAGFIAKTIYSLY